MTNKPVSYLLLFVLLVSLPFESLITVNGRLLLPLQPKPNRDDYVGYARWLASENSWGVLSTISIEMEGAPFANVVSYSDGAPGHGQGIPYFYLTSLDPTARDIKEDNRSSFAVSEFPVGTCGILDPEEPPCARLTLTGKMKMIPNDTSEADIAEKALFSKHPAMGGNAHDDAINAIALSGDGIFYTGSADTKIKEWRRSSGQKKNKHSLVATLEKHKSAINALVLSSDGSVLYSGACDRSIVVWERKEGMAHMAVVGALRGHTKTILCVAVASDLVLSGSAVRRAPGSNQMFDGRFGEILREA